MSYSSSPRAQWRSYPSYIFVTLGAIVGLGNIFQFPFLVTQYGGLFLLFYVASELLISVPLLFSELLIGRRGKQNPVGSVSILAMESNASSRWRLLGWLCFLIVFLTLSYYIVSVAFPLTYLFDITKHAVTTSSTPFDIFSMEHSTNSASVYVLEICFLLFLLATLLVIVRGINRGLEAISFITVPSYFLILLALAVYSSLYGDFGAAVNYLFHIPDNQAIWPVLFAALTFAFFKLNVGMGSMIVYGSYLPYSVPLGKSTAIILSLDAVVSLLSYFIIAPLLLHSNLLAQNAAWSYHNVMQIFSAEPHSAVIAALFFLAAVIAAWTATIAMAETAVLTLIERFSLKRCSASLIIGASAVFVGSIVVFSPVIWPDILLFSRWSIAGFIQNFASDIATPISAFIIAIFCGWIVKRYITMGELSFPSMLYAIWRFLIRYIVPICIVIVLLEVGFS